MWFTTANQPGAYQFSLRTETAYTSMKSAFSQMLLHWCRHKQVYLFYSWGIYRSL